jgi:hypothetical protein
MRIALAIALTLTAAAQSFAATYSVAPAFVGAFSTDGSFTPIAGYELNSGIPAILQFDMIVNTSGFDAPALGFANGVFTIGLSSGLSNTSAGGWNPSPIPNVDSNGATPGGVVPLLSDNADLAAQDLKDILLGVATPLTTNPNVDPRFKFGQGTTANYNAGTVYIDYAGGAQELTAGFTQVSALFQDGAAARYIGTLDANGNMPLFVQAIGVPEPTTCVLAGLALVGAAAHRRV